MKVLAALWYYTSREKLLYVQRYGVFDSRTGKMVAWGTLITPSHAREMLGGEDMALMDSPEMAETR